MTFDRLCAELRQVSIDANQSVIDGASIRDQHLWMAMKFEICDELVARGQSGIDFFMTLLTDELPIMRLTGAINVRTIAPERAMPVLEELVGNGNLGSIEVDARSALYDLYKLR